LRLYRQAGNIKAALFLGAVILVTGLLFYTQSIIEDLREENRETVSLYAQLIVKVVTDPNDTELDFVFSEIIQKVRFPIIYSDQSGIPVLWRNLPEDGKLDSGSVRRFMIDMDSQNDPIPLVVTVPSQETAVDTSMILGYLHYGDSILIRQLRRLPYIEIGAAAIFILLGYIGFQIIRRNEKQHIWFGMSKETAHQLGTPVSSLMGWIERLKDNPQESERVSDQMASDIARLQQISDRFSRMGSLPTFQKVNLRDLLVDTVKYYKTRLPKTGRDISLAVQEGDPIFIQGTSLLLSWAFENIVKNAIDSIDKPNGSVFLEVTQKGREAIISIKDNGRGIPRRDWKNVFRPGYSTKERGWGLGLSLTKRIIEEFQKGKVLIRTSEVGKGTTFEIRLPG